MASTNSNRKSVLELTVNNHPGVMAAICGLFARRAFNVEGILCMPIGNGNRSRLWLLVNEDERLDQVEKQLMKLVDVVELQHHGAEHRVFENLESFFKD
jgi:acetolactate synthase-1/3 small subunit